MKRPPRPTSITSVSVRTIGVDTGGTFTDLVAIEGERVEIAKLASTPAAPMRAVVAGVRHLAGPRPSDRIVHGTTVALNALLTRSIARTALVTNAGFADVIEIGRQDRPELYALHPAKPPPLVPRELRFEVHTRAWPRADGRGLERVARPSAEELAALARNVRAAHPESIAICLLHSYADPELEEELERALAPLGIPLTLSARVLPEHREYERFSTAVVNAALVPILRDYLAGLARALAPARLAVLQSSGGALSAEAAAREPVRVLLSGPAGGVIGAARAARDAGFERMVALDMGGTSTDVAFHGARSHLVGQARAIGGAAVAVPALDIHTIGCGGGSIVDVDAGGVLHVGPESAGADPGPVCYGASERPTVTDAHVYLGHVARGAFLGGTLELDTDAVARAFERLGKRAGLRPAAAAQAVLDVARAAMRRALAVMTMQRGEDPRAVPLVAFGGAGGLHATALAESLSMPAALVPRHAGLLSAFGMATAAATREATRSVLAPLASLGAGDLERALAELAASARAALAEEGHSVRSTVIERRIDLRYVGQSYELSLPFSRRPSQDFHRAHEDLYGFRLESREIEVVALRARAIARGREHRLAPVRAQGFPGAARIGTRRALFHGRRAPVAAAVFDGALILPGQALTGPALVEDFSGTTLVPPRWRARATAGGHLLLERS